MIEVSLNEARRIAVRAQGLHQADTEQRGAQDILGLLGCVQLDTIHTVRRSHELVLLARGVSADDAAGFLRRTGEPYAFEYWGHAASLLPLRLWPLFAFRREHYARDGWRGPYVDPDAVTFVRAAVAERGPVTIGDLGGADGTGWERQAPAKWAAEWLLATGELACVSRRGWSRVYEPASAVIPDHLLSARPAIEECVGELARIALTALGIGTDDDIADYFRLPKDLVRDHLRGSSDIDAVSVAGWNRPAWAMPDALEPADTDPYACTPLSPFDSLIWHRPRAKRLFGIDYVLEAYKPAAKRECGYFGMPVLAGDRIIGRFALRTGNGVSQVEGYQVVDGEDPYGMHDALHTAATWAGARLAAAGPLCRCDREGPA